MNDFFAKLFFNYINVDTTITIKILNIHNDDCNVFITAEDSDPVFSKKYKYYFSLNNQKSQRYYDRLLLLFHHLGRK